MRVLGNRILVRLDNPTAGVTIIAPELTRKMADSGIVLQRGSGPNLPAEIKVGARVRVDNRYNSVGFPKSDSRDRIYSVSDLLAIIG